LCEKNNINVMMTSNKCLTGTDRVAEIAAKTNLSLSVIEGS